MLAFLLQLALGCGLTLFGFAWYPCGCDTGCVCSECQGGTAGSEWEVTFSGITDGGTCTDCVDLNDTFTLTQDSDCLWSYDFPGSTCAPFYYDRIELELSCDAGTDQQILEVRIMSTDPFAFGTGMVWQLVGSPHTKLDCTNFTSELVQAVGTGVGAGICNAGSADCHATSLP